MKKVEKHWFTLTKTYKYNRLLTLPLALIAILATLQGYVGLI